MANWPDYAKIMWDDVAATVGWPVQRTEFDSGEVAQRRRNTRRRILREATVSIPHSDRGDWDEWMTDNGAGFNDVPDTWSGVTLSLRIQGGEINMTPAADRRDGARHWTGRLTFEGWI